MLSNDITFCSVTGEISVCNSVVFGPLLPHIVKHLDDAYDIKTEVGFISCDSSYVQLIALSTNLYMLK